MWLETCSRIKLNWVSSAVKWVSYLVVTWMIRIIATYIWEETVWYKGTYRWTLLGLEWPYYYSLSDTTWASRGGSWIVLKKIISCVFSSTLSHELDGKPDEFTERCEEEFTRIKNNTTVLLKSQHGNIKRLLISFLKGRSRRQRKEVLKHFFFDFKQLLHWLCSDTSVSFISVRKKTIRLQPAAPRAHLSRSLMI